MIRYSAYGRTWTLTTEHAASSYGTPVLVDDAGVAYGPADVVVRAEPDVGFAAAAEGATDRDVTAAEIVRYGVGLGLPDAAYERDRGQADPEIEGDEGPLTDRARAMRDDYLAMAHRFLALPVEG